MASQSPPKPWERAAAGSSSVSALPTSPMTTATLASTSDQPPGLPSKPTSLSSVVNRNASNYSPYASSPAYGSSLYGGMGTGIGGYGAYSSPYSRFGSSMYGGYGSMYGMGGMNSMYGGMGGYGGPGMMGGDPNSLSNVFSQSTQTTFQMIESIVGAFGGFAQMLESTYMATHSSFFAMISVAEQFSSLRDTLGSILGIFAIMRWARTLLAKITGRPPPADAASLTPAAFAHFNGQPAVLPDGTPAPARPSRKPFLVFILAAFGLPYLMGKFIRAIAKSQEAAQRQNQNLLIGPDGQPLPPDQQPGAVDPSQLDFCRMKYDFTPENPGSINPGIDIEVKKGDIVAVLARTDPLGNPSEWWRCRTRDGKIGYLPSPYMEVIKRTPKQLTQGSISGSRAQTMTSGGISRTQTMKTEGAASAPPELNSKVGDISVESFQKSQFYS